MEWPEKYKKLIKAITDEKGTAWIDRKPYPFVDYSNKRDVEYIKENGKSFDKYKWGNIFNKFKNNTSVLLYMFNTFDIPDSFIRNVMAYNCSSDIYRQILKRNLEEHTLDVLYDKYLEYIPILFEEKNQNFSKSNLNYLAKRILNDEKINDKDDIRHSAKISIRCILTSFSDKTIAEDFYASGIESEMKNSLLASNKNLPVSLRNDFFNRGYDYQFVVDATDDMKRTMYESVVNVLDNATEYTEDNLVDAKNQLMEYAIHIGGRNMTTEAIELDLANRLIDIAGRKSIEPLTVLMSNTQYQSVLRIGANTKNKNTKNTVYENSHMPKDMIVKRVDAYCGKIEKRMDGKCIKPIYPSEWTEQMIYYCKCTTLSDKSYETLLKIHENRLNDAIALSSETPIHVLDKIIECGPSIYDMYVWSNKFCRQHNIENNDCLKLVDFLLNIARTLKPQDQISSELHSKDFLDNFLGKYHCEKDLNKFLDELSTVYVGTPYLYSSAKDALVVLNNYMHNKQALKNDDYKSMTTNYLLATKLVIVEECFKEHSIHLFTNADEYAERMNKIEEELENRGYDKNVERDGKEYDK